MIQLQFLSEDGFEDSIIKWSTRSQWTHVQIVVPQGFLGSDTDGGVKVRQITDYKPVHIDIGTVNCDDATTTKIMDWAWSKVGCKYDYAAVIGDLFNADWTQKGTFDCSAFVQCAFLAGNYPLLNLGYTKWINPGACQ